MTTTYQLTPTTVDGNPVDNPIRWVFENGEVNSTAVLDSGLYPPPGIVERMNPSLIMAAEVDRDAPTVWIRRASQDTLQFAYPETCCNILFRGIGIEGSSRAGVMFWSNKGADYRNIHFEDCWIDGGWDFVKNEGTSTKWGVLAHSTDLFSWVRGGIKNIRWEHCFYDHNLGPGKHVFQNVKFGPCGRTWIQTVGRVFENDGQPSDAEIEITGGRFVSCGLADGGSGFTFSGQAGTVTIDSVTARHGFDPDLAKYPGGGMLTVWAERGDPNDPINPKPGTPNGYVVVKNSTFENHPKVGPRSLMRVAACEGLYMSNTTLEAGTNPLAVDINPLNDHGMGAPEMICKRIVNGGGNTIKGRAVVGGAVVYDSEAGGLI